MEWVVSVEVRHVIKEVKGDYRLIAISDIHGHLDRFKLLLKEVNYTPEDYLVIIGDFVEKGDQVIETIHYVMELDKNERTLVLLGNCEWAMHAMLTIEDIADQIPKYLNRVSTNGCIRHVYNLYHYYDHKTPDLEVQHTILNYLKEEMDYISTLPTTLKFNNFLFVHAGLEKREDYTKCGLSSMLEMKYFLDYGHILDEIVIVGHLPTSNYRKTINNDIIFDFDKKIICIDGGTGVKPIAQLNALIIENKNDTITYNQVSVDTYPEYEVIHDCLHESQSVHKIAYPDYEIEILEKGDHFSLCRQNSSNICLNIKNEFIYTRNNQYYCLDDYTDNKLSVKKGDYIKLIGIYGDYVYAKKNQQVGWLKISDINYK